jgi:hypothetical protein
LPSRPNTLRVGDLGTGRQAVMAPWREAQREEDGARSAIDRPD